MATRQIRDLAWCLHSPSLAAEDTFYPGDPWFRALNAPTEVAADFPAPPDAHHFRLGQHFERLWQYWFEHDASTRLVAANLQVREGKRTVGEFDFLVEREDGVEHWEVAVKFYLGRSPTADLRHWYGPNTTDTLAGKLGRLREHQLLLGGMPAAEALLRERDITLERVRGIIKGRLFYPWPDFIRGDCLPPFEINPDHERGWWMSQAEFTNHDWQGAQFMRLTKRWWLAPIQAAEAEPVSRDAIIEGFRQPRSEQATHVAVLDDGAERHRGFIVNDAWLQRAKINVGGV